jgi:hypothetical protein
MRKIILAGIAALALCVHADAANWPSTSGSTVPGSVIEDGAGQKVTAKPHIATLNPPSHSPRRSPMSG